MSDQDKPVTHTNYTADQIAQRIIELKAEHVELAREHGKYVPTFYAEGYLGAGEPSGGYTVDNTRELRRAAQTIKELEYEHTCALALVRSGFNIGDRVKVGPPAVPFAFAIKMSPTPFGHDEITDQIAVVRGITSNGNSLLVTYVNAQTAARFDGAPTSRCTKIP